MNHHLKLVREFYSACSFPQAEHKAKVRLSDMDIIMYQALLMDEGSNVFKAIKKGEMAEILLGLVDLAYIAIGAISVQGEEVVEDSTLWTHDGFVLSIMQLLSDKIHHCSGGSADNYSVLYKLCIHLTTSFLNADFDKAFQKIHSHKMSKLEESCDILYLHKLSKSKLLEAFDLTECFYE